MEKRFAEKSDRLSQAPIKNGVYFFSGNENPDPSVEKEGIRLRLGFKKIILKLLKL